MRLKEHRPTVKHSRLSRGHKGFEVKSFEQNKSTLCLDVLVSLSIGLLLCLARPRRRSTVELAYMFKDITKF